MLESIYNFEFDWRQKLKRRTGSYFHSPQQPLVGTEWMRRAKSEIMMLHERIPEGGNAKITFRRRKAFVEELGFDVTCHAVSSVLVKTRPEMLAVPVPHSRPACFCWSSNDPLWPGSFSFLKAIEDKSHFFWLLSNVAMGMSER
jgi:hypothetical protein